MTVGPAIFGAANRVLRRSPAPYSSPSIGFPVHSFTFFSRLLLHTNNVC